ncbi:MAG: caspase family protein [Spirochaetaceae bacterium]|jgi:WD40 repeat protein|nr:caspase family protein [Spirochaetaceae bacterium]
MKKFPLLTAAPLCTALLLCACVAGPRIGPGTEKASATPDVRVFPQVSGGVNSAVFSPDGRYVLTGDNAGAVKVWEAETGILVKSFYSHDGEVKSVAWSRDGKYIASGSIDNTIKIWDVDSFSSEVCEPRTFQHQDKVYSVDFSPDSSILVSTSADKTTRFWNVSTGRQSGIWKGYSYTVHSAIFSPDGKQIVAVSDDAKIMVCDLAASEIRALDSGYLAAWSPDGEYIVNVSGATFVSDQEIKRGVTVRIIDLNNSKAGWLSYQQIGDFVWNDQDVVYGVKFSPDGTRIVTVGSVYHYPIIKIWDVETGAMIREFSAHINSILNVDWSHDGKHILTASADTTARLWDVETGKCIKTFAETTYPLTCADISKDGKRIATSSINGKVNIWNAETGILEQSFEHINSVYAVVISPDGRKVAAGAFPSYIGYSGLNRTNSSEDEIKIWDVETGKELFNFGGHDGYVFSLSFNPDGKHLASSSGDRTIRIWDTETGKELDILRGHRDLVSSVAFSTDGKRLVSGSYDNTICIWESSDTGKYILFRRFTTHHYEVNSVAFNSDGKKVVCGFRDHTIEIYDIETDLTMTLEADINILQIRSVGFSPNDRYIIASTDNKNILKWEISNDGTYHYKGANNKLLNVAQSLSYTSNGTRILAGISDGTARLYNADDLSEIACFVYFTGEDGRAVTKDMSQETARGASRIDGEWLTITHDGYYRSSSKGARFINVLIDGRRLSTIDAYSGIFYRPDVVEARLRGRQDPPNTGLSIQQAGDFEPPSIIIKSPAAGSTVTGNGTVTLKVEVKDRNQPIKDIRVLVNGVRIGGEELRTVTGTPGITAVTGGLSLRRNIKTVEFTVPVTLVERGSNRIEVMAFNGYSWGYSGEYGNVDVNWEPPTGTEVPLPDLWILAVGVNAYDNAGTGNLPSLGNLNYCANDAKELVKSFEAQQGKRYSTVHSRLIIDGGIEPTAENILKHLSFLEGAGPRDVVLLFLGGHGISEGNKFYFLTKDAVMKNGKVNPAYAISDEVLKKVMDKPGRRLIFIDACNSGGMDIDSFMHSLQRTNAYMLAASEGDKYSYEDPPERLSWKWGGHGVFSYSIIRSLNGETDVPRGNWDGISVLGLSWYVREDVKKLTENLRYQQKPVPYTWGFSDFDIAR